MKKLWHWWKKTSLIIVDKEATVLLFILYWILITPFALLSKIISDPLNMKSGLNSYWFPKDNSNFADQNSLKKQ